LGLSSNLGRLFILSLLIELVDVLRHLAVVSVGFSTLSFFGRWGLHLEDNRVEVPLDMVNFFALSDSVKLISSRDTSFQLILRSILRHDGPACVHSSSVSTADLRSLFSCWLFLLIS